MITSDNNGNNNKGAIEYCTAPAMIVPNKSLSLSLSLSTSTTPRRPINPHEPCNPYEIYHLPWTSDQILGVWHGSHWPDRISENVSILVLLKLELNSP